MPNLLEKILFPLPVSSFVNQHWYNEAVHIKGTPAKFEDLFDWHSLNNLLSSLTLTGQQIKLSRGGASFFSSDAQQILREARQGTTLILEDIDNRDPKLGPFLNQLSDEICMPTRTNLYLSFPGKQGYRIHYDTHDFFILQLEGFKRWNVYPATVESPLFFQKTHGIVPPRKEQLYLSCVLKRGDVLYVPKGHWHEAISFEEPSMHLTVALFAPTGIDFLNWLVDELRDDPRVRESLPLILKEALPDHGRSVPQLDSHLSMIKEAVVQKMGSESLGFLFFRYSVARQKNRIPFIFPQQIAVGSDVPQDVMRFKRVPISTFVADREDGKVELIYSGRIAVFDHSIKPILRLMLTSQEFTKDDLLACAPEFSWEQVLPILSTLITEGLIVFSTASNNP